MDMKRSISFVLAAILPLILFPWFVPTPANQLDFWLMWLVAMLILALPMVYAEVALAYRSGNEPLSGIQKLTREADVSAIWRGSIWFGVLVALTVSAYLISWSSTALLPTLTKLGIEGVPTFAVMLGLMVIAVILSMLGSISAVIGLICAIVGLAMTLANGIIDFSLQMTPVTLSEWGRAVMLALVSVGAGSGLYWFTNSGNGIDYTSKPSASKAVLPIWGVQLIAGAIALVVASVKTSEPSEMMQIANVITAIGSVCLAAALIYYARQILSTRFGMMMAMVIALLLGLLLVVIPGAILLMLLVVLVSVSVLMLSIFAGWLMKISHLRKSMNFSSEGFYNIWRIAIRIIVPLAVLVGLVGWLAGWVN